MAALDRADTPTAHKTEQTTSDPEVKDQAKAAAPQLLVEAVRKAAVNEPLITEEAAAAMTGGAGVLAAGLSPQEARVLALYASNLTMQEVANRLHISYDTAKCYIDRARSKYEAAGRAARTKLELHRRAIEDGLIDLK